MKNLLVILLSLCFINSLFAQSVEGEHADGGVIRAGTAPGAPKIFPEYMGKLVLFGNLHAHSALSDDVKTRYKRRMTPKKAYSYAMKHGLDFLALTDHHKGYMQDQEGRLILDEKFKIGDDEYHDKSYEVAMKFNERHTGQFVAIPGIEWGTTSTGNHINIFGAASLPNKEEILDHHYLDLIEWAREYAEFIQFNHPNSGGSSNSKRQGNYGVKQYTNEDEFVEVVDPVVKTISLITTVGGGHITGKHRHSEKKVHRRGQWEKYYKRYLNMGFHLSPSANQDTHYTNWGSVTAARTAVWSDGVTYSDLMEAFRSNRVYATEDDELVVAFTAEYGGKTYWMGDSIEIGHDESTIDIKVQVWQASGIDQDPLDEGPYTIELLSDWDGVGEHEAAVWDVQKGVKTGELAMWQDIEVVDGEYIYIRVREEGGQDNLLGDGEDVLNNETGVHKKDGKRDNMNDTAWTSPIWFTK
ncbi:MAG: hypothetical protein GKR93_17980 [Gammaproteobacteria bacterium]|nr:hypothetical protein [Gammaproteobacteria bacterium]